MRMELIVSYVGDLATLVGTAFFVTPACSPPDSFLFVCKSLGIRKFFPWQVPCAVDE